MFEDLKDKVVLVTGSNIGIGAATVKLFASLGSKVVITGRNKQRIESVANECCQLSPNKYKPLTVVCDLTNEEQVKQLAQKTIEQFGRVNVFVSNASTFRDIDILDENVLNGFDISTIANNRCSIQLLHLLLPSLIESKGCIVNISATPQNIFPLAAMAKAASDTVCKVLAKQIASNSVRINTVHVGATLTESVIASPYLEEWKNDFIPNIPLRRFAEPYEVANCIVFLASDLASFMTGVELKCDGGVLLS